MSMFRTYGVGTVIPGQSGRQGELRLIRLEFEQHISKKQE